MQRARSCGFDLLMVTQSVMIRNQLFKNKNNKYRHALVSTMQAYRPSHVIIYQASITGTGKCAVLMECDDIILQESTNGVGLRESVRVCVCGCTNNVNSMTFPYF